jgi:4-hydroxyphenylpyruvate dioxygenase
VAGLPDLPPRATCHGVTFAEFAMDEEAASRFEGLLRGLGFTKVGRHRTKSVSRWNQGDINIVVNSEKEGFAHSFHITHGSSVCALALKVEDASATVDRALKLRDQPFRQAVAPGELDIPAVRGVGGGLVYFTDERSALGRNWDIDFRPTGEAAGPGAGLTAIDHVSHSMQYEEMLTWLLFYNSLLDTVKTPVQSVIDPGGVVQSQVVENRDGTLRIVLNASQSRHTLSSRFLNDFFGSGIQHIALATTDIVATAKRLKANGIEVLPIPENYYDDLEARSDLGTDEIETLKAHNVLYDREGPAEFFQLYTRTIENGFFFEIVERRDYKGFGAVNAPIRLAAQTRLAPLPSMPRL